MSKKKTLNPRRLTKAQVADLIDTGAILRQDLMACFERRNADGSHDSPKVYALEGDRFLFVFDENDISCPGKGDIYPGDYFRRFARWAARIRDEREFGGTSSVGNWHHHSKLKALLPANISRLISELALAAGLSERELDFSYKSLAPLSLFVESYGAAEAAAAYYDHLVAYVGEVQRQRVKGEWRIDHGSPDEPYPYIHAERHGPIMPINVVWEQLGGLDPVNLRSAAANEIRSAKLRAPLTRSEQLAPGN